MKNESTLSGLTVANFSKQIDGKETMLCILTNNKGAELTITNYGAKIVSLMVPDRSGKLTDVVTGHNSIDEYLVFRRTLFRSYLRTIRQPYRERKIHIGWHCVR